MSDPSLPHESKYDSSIQHENKSLLVEETLVTEGTPKNLKRPGRFERIFRFKFLSIKTLLIIIGLLILAALLGSLGHFVRLARVLYDQSKSVDGIGINNDLFNQFNLFEQYSAAAYCPQNQNSSMSKLACATNNCPLVEAADTRSEIEFSQ
jgi:hypothetical protein